MQIQRVLLINPQFRGGYIHSARWDGLTISGSHWYPIFLAYATGYLMKYSHNCKLVDAEAENISDPEMLQIARRYKPDFTIIYVSERGLDFNTTLGKKIKKATGSKIVFVGPWCSMDIVKKRALEGGIADYLIDGEFEFVLKDVVENRIEKTLLLIPTMFNFKLTKGTKIKTVIIKSRRLDSGRLNELPWVTKTYKRFLNIENYRIGSLYHPFVDMFTGRKCYWGKCSFCLWPNTILKEGGYEARDIEDVLDEIEWAVKNMDIREIFIQDDTPPAFRCRELAEGIIKRGIKIKWSTYARGDLTLTPEILRLMKESGCHCLHVGYESGNDELLKTMNKGVTKETLTIFTDWCNNAGIDIHGDFLLGLPGETPRTIRETIDWAKSLNILTYQFALPKPYPCTPYYKWMEEHKMFGYNGSVKFENFTEAEMQNWWATAMKETYFNLRFIRRIIFRPSEWGRLLTFAKFVIPSMLNRGKD